TLVGHAFGDTAIELWETATGKSIKVIGKAAQPGNVVRGRNFSPFGQTGAVTLSTDGKTLIFSEGNAIRLVDLGTGKELPGAGGHAGPINLVRFEAGGKRLATHGQDGTLRLWDTTGKETGQVNIPQTAYTFSLSPDGKLLWTSNLDGTCRLVDVATGKEVR